MGSTKEKKLVIISNVSEQTLDKLKTIAEKDNRSVKNTVETIICNSVEELHYEFTNVEPYQEMVKLQEEYTKFLAKHLNTIESMLRTQSWFKTNEKSIEQGKVFREKISKLKFKLKPL